MALSCRKPRRQIREIFVRGTLAPAALGRLWTHLRTCDDCRARYDRALRLQRVVATGGVQVPSAFELELLVPMVTAQPEPERPPVSERFGLRWLAPALSFCLVVALGGVLLWQLRQPEETWRSRALGSATLAVRAFCREGDVIRSLSVDPGPQERSSCTAGSSLAFAVISDEAGHLYVARRDRGRLLWLLPEESGGEPLALETATELKALPIRVDLIDSQEQITVSFVRTPAPVPTERIESWLEAWDEGDLPAGVAIVERRVPIEPAAEEGEP